MTLTVHRELTAVADGILRWIESARHQPYELVECRRPSDGLSSETVILDVALPGASDRESIAVRLPPVGDGAFPTYDLAAQVDALRLAAAHGVPVPAPVELVLDEQWVGAPFLVMPAVDGHVPGPISLRDEWIVKASPQLQRRMYDEFIEQLAALHTIEGHIASGRVPERGLEAELEYWQRYLEWYADGDHVVPALDDALDWCVRHRPSEEPPAALLWGDVRLGNVIFDDARRPVAILDWEMATIGAPEHDVAWWRTLEATQDELFGRRVEDFPTADDSLRLYEERLGRPLVSLEWFEVLAMVRSTAVMTRLAVLHERAGQPGFFPIAENPILPLIARRIEQAG